MFPHSTYFSNQTSWLRKPLSHKNNSISGDFIERYLVYHEWSYQANISFIYQTKQKGSLCLQELICYTVIYLAENVYLLTV